MHNGYDLAYGGEISSSPFDMAYILGGLNLWGNPDLFLTADSSNAVCLLGLKFNPLLGIQERTAYGCEVTFAPQTTLFKRSQDPDDPSTWVVESKCSANRIIKNR